MGNNICIIPARGGSKRIPKKNIREFLGKPIIAYSIQAALQSNLFAEVMVSTDDDEIIDIAERYGANVPFKRSAATADDNATTAEVVLEVLGMYESKGYHYENICCVYPCAPFITSDNLMESYSRLMKKNLDGIFPVVAFNFPVQRALKIEGDLVGFCYPEFSLTRSQDLEKVYHDAGQYYWINNKAFKRDNAIVTVNCGAIIISEMEAQDIDNEIDWKLAEMKFQFLRK